MQRPDGLLRTRHLRSWLLIFSCFLYFVFCWTAYTFTVDPIYGQWHSPTISADSGAYFQLAGLADPTIQQSVDQGSLVSLGGSSLGPVIIALLGRGLFGVACINCLLFLLTLYLAARVPGVRWEVFGILLALNAQTVPTLMTLNKEMPGIAGIVAFGAYLYSGERHGRKNKSLLFFAIVLSVFARWQQAVILFWYLFSESRWSTLRGRPRRAIIVLLVISSVGYAVILNLLHLNLSGFLLQTEGAGTIVRLNDIQQKGGYFLVAGPKILMNLAGRLVTPAYFLDAYWAEDFGGSLQNQYIGFLANLAMLSALAYSLIKGRFRLTHPLIHLTLTYFIFTAINPFIQPRYMYPGYAVLVLELARRRTSLEKVKPLPIPPALPPSYKTTYGLQAPSRS